MQSTGKFELRIFNDFAEFKVMNAWLQNVFKTLALPELLAKDLDVCANEAVTNIILYAYQDQKSHQIQMQFEFNENKEICLTIQDDGSPFDPFNAVLTDNYEKIDGLNIGGLGIQLMRSLTNQCHYRWLDGKNNTTLCFCLP